MNKTTQMVAVAAMLTGAGVALLSDQPILAAVCVLVAAVVLIVGRRRA